MRYITTFKRSLYILEKFGFAKAKHCTLSRMVYQHTVIINVFL